MPIENTTPVVGRYDYAPGGTELILEGPPAKGAFELQLTQLKIDPSAKEIKVQVLLDFVKTATGHTAETKLFQMGVHRKVEYANGSGFYYEQIATFDLISDPFTRESAFQAKFTATAKTVAGYVYTDEYFIGAAASAATSAGQALSGRYLIRVGSELGDFKVNGQDYRYHLWGQDWLGAGGSPTTPPPTPTPTPVALPSATQPVLQPEPTPEPLHDTYVSAPYHLDTARGVWTQGGVELTGVPATEAGLLKGLAGTYFDDVKASLLAMRDRASADVRAAIDKLSTPELKALVDAFKVDETETVVRFVEIIEGTRDINEFAALDANLDARLQIFEAGGAALLNISSAVDSLFGHTTTLFSHSDLVYRMDVDLRAEKPLLQLAAGHKDVFLGSVDRDWVEGGDLNDALIGRDGADQLFGGDGNDLISGGAGQDYLRGDLGDDRMIGGADFDDLNGNMGADTAAGGLGDDWVVGGKDNDSLAGDAGADLVYGNLGNDTCEGGDGNDIVRGGQDNDLVLGGAGADYLSGDRGSDTMTGGAGADIFHSFGETGADRVTDFSRLQGDRVMLDPGTTYTTAQVGADVVITMSGGGQMTLVGVQMSALTGDWIFVG